MNYSDRRLAQAVIKRLCQGAQIDGIRFGPILQLLLTIPSSSKLAVKGQVYLNLASTWDIFDRLPSMFLESETDLPRIAVGQQIAAICSIREQVISEARLEDGVPHLILTLESGKVLFLNGHHEKYETWQLGVAFNDPAEPWMVVACPGDNIAVWASESFIVSLRSAS